MVKSQFFLALTTFRHHFCSCDLAAKARHGHRHGGIFLTAAFVISAVLLTFGATESGAWGIWIYQLPSGNLTVCYWKWPFIVSFPIKKNVIFHSYVNVYQRVYVRFDHFEVGWTRHRFKTIRLNNTVRIGAMTRRRDSWKTEWGLW